MEPTNPTGSLKPCLSHSNPSNSDDQDGSSMKRQAGRQGTDEHSPVPTHSPAKRSQHTLGTNSQQPESPAQHLPKTTYQTENTVKLGTGTVSAPKLVAHEGETEDQAAGCFPAPSTEPEPRKDVTGYPYEGQTPLPGYPPPITAPPRASYNVPPRSPRRTPPALSGGGSMLSCLPCFKKDEPPPRQPRQPQYTQPPGQPVVVYGPPHGYGPQQGYVQQGYGPPQGYVQQQPAYVQQQQGYAQPQQARRGGGGVGTAAAAGIGGAALGGLAGYAIGQAGQRDQGQAGQAPAHYPPQDQHQVHHQEHHQDQEQEHHGEDSQSHDDYEASEGGYDDDGGYDDGGGYDDDGGGYDD